VTEDSLDENVNVAELELLVEGGPLTMVTVGGMVSTVNVSVPATPVLPAASVAVAESVLLPSPSGGEAVQLQLPFASAVAVQTGKPATVTVTVLPGSAVPETTGVAVAMLDPDSGVVNVGAAGATVSTVQV
jgi:hypothetical protein